MYCKYCGQEVKTGTRCCPHCGREIASVKSREEGAGTAFYVMLALPVLPTLLSFLLMGEMLLVNWVDVMRQIVTVSIGIAGLLHLCQSGRIRPGRFRGGDALTWALWLYLPILAYFLAARVVYAAAGQHVLKACVLLQNAEMWLGELGGLWVWVELAVLGLIRSGSLKVTAKKTAITLAVLAVWSVMIYVLRAPILRTMVWGEEQIMSYLLEGSALYFLTIWMRRGFELAFMAVWGGRRLRPVRSVLVPVILNVLVVVLTPVTVFTMGFGILGIGITATGAYLLSALLLSLLAKKEAAEQV